MGYKFSFERLRVWEDVMTLTEEIYQVTADFPKEELYGLTNQLRRAIVSVSSNLAEGVGRISKKEQARFTEIAYSSLMEVLSQLLVAEQLNYVSEEKIDAFRKDIMAISNQLNALRNAQKNRIEEPTVPYQPLNPSTFQLSEPGNYFIHSTSIVDTGAQIGKNTKIWHFCHVMSGATIGANCSLGQNVFVANGVVLGDNVKVQNNVSIYEGVTCEDDVFLGPSMVFTNVINPRSAVNRKNEYLSTRVGKGASIGANATIICGNSIGKYAFIGAGAVVTGDVPDYALVVGNPARQIGWMSAHGERLEFLDGKAVCNATGDVYVLEKGEVRKVGMGDKENLNGHRATEQ